MRASLSSFVGVILTATSVSITAQTLMEMGSLQTIEGATVLGAAVFLRYSLAAFLRFWLARLIYEQQSQTERLLAARETSEPSRV